MEIASQLQFVVGILASVLVTGAWWYAALHKRKIAIFYWLAATHSLSFGLHLLIYIYILSGTAHGRISAVGGIQTLMSLILAALYIALVRWLVKQP